MLFILLHVFLSRGIYLIVYSVVSLSSTEEKTSLSPIWSRVSIPKAVNPKKSKRNKRESKNQTVYNRQFVVLYYPVQHPLIVPLTSPFPSFSVFKPILHTGSFVFPLPSSPPLLRRASLPLHLPHPSSPNLPHVPHHLPPFISGEPLQSHQNTNPLKNTNLVSTANKHPTTYYGDYGASTSTNPSAGPAGVYGYPELHHRGYQAAHQQVASGPRLSGFWCEAGASCVQ